MKKILFTIGIVVLLSGVVYAVADYLTSDPTIRKTMPYGETSGGVPVKILVDASGIVQL